MVGGIENDESPMPRTRKNHPPSLKAKIAVEAIKAQKTTTQISQMFGVHRPPDCRTMNWLDRGQGNAGM
jgi:transposase-like protein